MRRSLAIVLAVGALIAWPAAAGASRVVHFQRGGHTIEVVVKGQPRASDLRAIQRADYRGSGGGATASRQNLQACGRSVLSNQNCGNVPTDYSSWNEASYLGKGTVRVCAVSARANRFYPNGDPNYPWVGKCGDNSAGIGMPGWIYSYPNDGNWINNTVVNASPWTHTIWERLDFLPSSFAGVCGFDVQC